MKRAFALAGSVAAASLVFGCASKDRPAAEATAPAPAPVTSADPAVSATPSPLMPEPSSFSLAVKLTKRECFGSAGCNIEYHVEVTAPPELESDDHLYTVTYEVSGVEDGPQINSFTIKGLRYDRDDHETASTTTSHVKLTAKVTDVELTE